MAIRSVRVFQDAVERLADSPDDDLFQVIDELAERVADAAWENAIHIIPALAGVPNFMVVEAGKDTKGVFFRINTDGGGKWSSYLSRKESLEGNILQKAVREVVGVGNIRTTSDRALRRFNRSFQ